MSATVKIDFEPGLFDEGQLEATPELPAIQSKRQANRAPFIVAGVLLLVGGVSAALLLHKNLPFTQESYEARAILPSSEPHIVPVAVETPMRPLSLSARWCNGDEVICTTTISSTPVETLLNLSAAIPRNSAKQYRIRLAIVPVDEPDWVDTTELNMPPIWMPGGATNEQ